MQHHKLHETSTNDSHRLIRGYPQCTWCLPSLCVCAVCKQRVCGIVRGLNFERIDANLYIYGCWCCAHCNQKTNTAHKQRELARRALADHFILFALHKVSAHSRKMWLYFAYSKHVRWVTGYIDSTTALPVGLSLFFCYLFELCNTPTRIQRVLFKGMKEENPRKINTITNHFLVEMLPWILLLCGAIGNWRI